MTDILNGLFDFAVSSVNYLLDGIAVVPNALSSIVL